MAITTKGAAATEVLTSTMTCRSRLGIIISARLSSHVRW